MSASLFSLGKILFFVSLVTVLKLSTSLTPEDETGLLFLQIIFRHGDRAPIKLYPNDPNTAADWPEGLGRLTKLGKKQHYMLGKHIRNMYPSFITSHPNEVNVSSSNVDRCIRSAQSHLAGLYEPASEWSFHESLNWQPIPVYYLPLGEEQGLNFDYKCPRAKGIMDSFALSSDTKNEDKKTNLFQDLSRESGMNITKYFDAFLLFDTLFAEKKHNLTIPTWTEKYMKDLEELNDEFFYASSPVVHKLRAGPLLKRFIDTMTAKLNGELPEQKVQIYSSHDEVVGMLLSALGLYNGKRPPYASTLILELREDQNKQNTVHLLYLNSTNPEFGDQPSHVLQFEGCSDYCLLDYFKNFTKDLIPEDLAKECENH